MNIITVNATDDDLNWNTFMNHLIKEFSVENLCFLLEVIQFKKQLITDYDALFTFTNGPTENTDDIIYVFSDDSYGWCTKLPKGLPLSSIIAKCTEQLDVATAEETVTVDTPQSIDDTDDINKKYKDQINEIYIKYIRADAPLQINISESSKLKFMAEIIGMNDLGMQSILDTDDIDKDQTNDNKTDIYLKIFDNALREINDNLRDSFLRFKINGNHDEFEANINRNINIDINRNSNMITSIEMSTNNT